MALTLLVAAPALVLLYVIEGVLGLINRFAQQLNVFSLSQSLKSVAAIWIVWVQLVVAGAVAAGRPAGARRRRAAVAARACSEADTMSDKNDGGDKTEKPTPKKLQDARKKGDVAKSKDVTSTVGLMIWLALVALTIGYAGTRLAALYDSLFATIGQGWLHTGFAGAARTIGAQAAELALMLVAMLLVPVAAVGLLTDFLQAGPVLTFEKIKPKLDTMNPVEGVKRMFSHGQPDRAGQVGRQGSAAVHARLAGGQVGAAADGGAGAHARSADAGHRRGCCGA